MGVDSMPKPPRGQLSNAEIVYQTLRHAYEVEGRKFLTNRELLRRTKLPYWTLVVACQYAQKKGWIEYGDRMGRASIWRLTTDQPKKQQGLTGIYLEIPKKLKEQGEKIARREGKTFEEFLQDGKIKGVVDRALRKPIIITIRPAELLATWNNIKFLVKRLDESKNIDLTMIKNEFSKSIKNWINILYGEEENSP